MSYVIEIRLHYMKNITIFQMPLVLKEIEAKSEDAQVWKIILYSKSNWECIH